MRTLSRILFVTAIFAFFASQGFAQQGVSSGNQKKDASSVVTPGKFADKNNNGVCDNSEARRPNGKGANFVDKNGDGKCDNIQNGTTCKGNRNCFGKGNGTCCGQGKGNGCGQGKGNGYGQGHQHRNGCQNQKSNTSTSQPTDNQKN